MTRTPKVLDCSALAGTPGYDQATPDIGQHWTGVYRLPNGAWLCFNQVPLGEGYRRVRAVYGCVGATPVWLEVRWDRLDVEQYGGEIRLQKNEVRLEVRFGGKETICPDVRGYAHSTPLLSVDWISLPKANEPLDMAGLAFEPLRRNGQLVLPEPTHRPPPPEVRRLPSRLRQKLAARKK